jgi:hypothetical protein
VPSLLVFLFLPDLALASCLISVPLCIQPPTWLAEMRWDKPGEAKIRREDLRASECRVLRAVISVSKECGFNLHSLLSIANWPCSSGRYHSQTLKSYTLCHPGEDDLRKFYTAVDPWQAIAMVPGDFCASLSIVTIAHCSYSKVFKFYFCCSLDVPSPYSLIYHQFSLAD